MANWKHCSEVEQRNGVWVFCGTRISVDDLDHSLRAGGSVDDFVAWYGVPKRQVVAVVNYRDEAIHKRDQRRLWWREFWLNWSVTWAAVVLGIIGLMVYQIVLDQTITYHTPFIMLLLSPVAVVQACRSEDIKMRWALGLVSTGSIVGGLLSLAKAINTQFESDLIGTIAVTIVVMAIPFSFSLFFAWVCTRR